MNKRMVLTICDYRFFAQFARANDADVPYAESAPIAADMLISGVPRVQMTYDVEAGCKVKEDLRAAGTIR